MATLSYATTGTGPSSGGIGWINFGAGFSIAPGATISGLSVSLLDGSTMSFNISNTTISGSGFTYNAVTAPTFGGAAFGVDAYTGISGQVCLSSTSYTGPTSTTSRITMSNITVTDPNGNPVPNYTLIVVDSESTDSLTEQQQYITNGGVWTLFYTIDNTRIGPSISGLGTQTVTLTGVNSGNSSASVFTTQNPTSVSSSITTSGTSQAFTFGVAINKVQINKNIISRIYTSDQFNLIINGTPSNIATTTGSSTGLQPITSEIYGFIGNSYVINESMTTGSYSWLADYIQTVVWTNLTPGGTIVPSPGSLGDNVTLALGDVMIATITNSPNPNPPGRGISFI